MPEIDIQKRRDYQKTWRKQWRKKHPDREHAARIRDAISLLVKNGYTVLSSEQTITDN